LRVQAPAAVYRTRAGGAVAARTLKFAAVMQERFGSVTGKAV